VLNPNLLTTHASGIARIGKQRLSWLGHQLLALHQSLTELGIAFCSYIESLDIVLDRLAKTYDILSIACEALPGSEEQSDMTTLRNFFPHALITTDAMHSLIHPEDLPFSIEQLPQTFTEARIQIEHNVAIRPCFPEIEKRTNCLSVPDTIAVWQPYLLPNLLTPAGEIQAKANLHRYLFIEQHALTYKLTRNQLQPWSSSSKWSLYLALGILSPRYIYWELKKFESTVNKNQSTYWLWFELLWRDYFHFLHLKHGKRFFTEDGLYQRTLVWNYDPRLKQSILDAKTGYPLVDASLLELYQTGWMSNRGRQNVANFISKILRLDWRWGASLFEHFLIDYDVSSNYGNWQYLSGVGVDPREDRIFNVSLQAKKYDPTGAYLATWLPKLQLIPTPLRFQPWMMNGLEMGMYQCEIGKDYPQPIVMDPRVQLKY
jgi:deoxyribodipyrimidine photo-lyase